MVRNRMRLAWLGGTLSVLASLPIAAAPAITPLEVDVKLVIATDVSRSINDDEALVQRQGTADVFLDPDVVKAIQSGSLGRIAVAMLDWTIVRDKESAAALAAKIRAIPRTGGERTSISGALQRAMLMLDDSDRYIVAEKKVIDVSGDGPNNDGMSLQHVHDTTKDNGTIVNGLPIMDLDSDGYYEDLDKYYDACVVAGKGAFLIVVKAFKDFGTAMRRKLVLEISANETQIRQTLRELDSNPLLKTIAATNVSPGVQLLLKQPDKTYPGGCDKYGGYGVNGG